MMYAPLILLFIFTFIPFTLQQGCGLNEGYNDCDNECYSIYDAARNACLQTGDYDVVKYVTTLQSLLPEGYSIVCTLDKPGQNTFWAPAYCDCYVDFSIDGYYTAVWKSFCNITVTLPQKKKDV